MTRLPIGSPIGCAFGGPFRSTIKNGPPDLDISAGQRKKAHDFATRLDLQNRSLPINIGAPAPFSALLTHVGPSSPVGAGPSSHLF